MPAKITPDFKYDEKSPVCDRVNKLWAISCDSMRSKQVKRSPADRSLIKRALQQTNKRSKPMLLLKSTKKLASQQLKSGSRYLPSTHHIFPLPPPPHQSLYNIWRVGGKIKSYSQSKSQPWQSLLTILPMKFPISNVFML